MLTDLSLRVDKLPRVGTFVSLYSGAGGLDLGFEHAGFRPVWANDADSFAIETYNKLIPGHPATEGPIEDQKLPSRGSSDLVIGGPPCQGFSVAGNMNPDDPRSRHVTTFLDVVDELKPRAFIMENVKALAVNRRWRGLMDSLRVRAEAAGYKTQLVLLNAADFGVPQSRERMFLIGRIEGGQVRPEATTRDSPMSVRSALAGLPEWGSPGNDTSCEASVTLAKNPVLRRSAYAGMLFNGQGRPLHLDRPAPTLPASMGGNRTPIVDQRQLSNGGDSWIDQYHILLRKGEPPLGKAPEYLRRITVEEASALQSFPIGTHWAGPTSAQYRQIGNAVPPLLAYHTAVAVREALGLS